MATNLAEQYRSEALRRIFNLKSFTKDWPARKAQILSTLGPPAGWTAKSVVRLGDDMRDLFRLGAPPPGSGRTQSALASAGTVWEALVTYYLNLGYAGTDAVAIRETEVPECVTDALSVWSGANRLAADVDAMVLYIPGFSKLPPAKSRVAMKRQVEELFATRFHEATVVILACKTSWADSIQTPMLWSLLYRLRRDRVVIPGGFPIGSGVHSLDGLAGFSYTFVTVPSQDPADFTAGGFPALRAQTMSGGHHWGLKTKNTVAPSLAEFYARQAPIVPIVAPRDIGVALANEGRTGAGNLDLSDFRLV
jgi:hypothetical protein